MKRYTFVSLLFFLLALLPDSGSAQPTSANLTTNFKSRSGNFDLQLTLNSEPTNCTLGYYALPSRRRLSRDISKAISFGSFPISSTTHSLSATGLSTLKRTSRFRRPKRFFFVAYVLCGDAILVSNIDSIRVRRKNQGITRPRRWLQEQQVAVAAQAVALESTFQALTFAAPVDLQNAGDSTDRLFVVEQAGIIQVFPNDPATTATTTFLDISDRVLSGGERGLLGLAFHPNYQTNGFFFVNYTDAAGDTVISRFSVSDADLNKADETSELVLLQVGQPFSNHNAGQLAFGPDGFLYIGLGDGGSGGDPQGNGQNPRTLLGSMLRIDVDSASGAKNYTVPPDNPFVGNSDGVPEETYAFGLRNPFRYSFDPHTGDLYAGDVGQNAIEEIDIIESGKNYGWNTMEGNSCFQPKTGCDMSDLTRPIFDYPHEQGRSVTGGYVYRGSALPVLQGIYLYADFISGRVWALKRFGKNVVNIEIENTALNPSSFGVDEAGEVYMLDYSSGGIYRFVGE